MSLFHESIRELLEDVFYFLNTSLGHEISLLSQNVVNDKDNLITRLKSFQDLYPQLHLILNDSTKFTQKEKLVVQNSHPSLSYVDMKGQVLMSDPDEEKYASCGSEKSLESENQPYNESEDGHSCDEYKCTPVPANKIHYFEKCGFLEKKGKERLGGLLSSSLKRWYAVSQGLLYYYDKPVDQVQKGVIHLEGYEARPLTTTKDKKNNFCFELVCPGRRTYQFSASSALEVKEWITVLDRNSKVNYRKVKTISPPKSEDMENQLNFRISEDIYEELDDNETDPVFDDNSTNNPQDRPVLSNSPNGSIPGSIINYRELYIGLWDCTGDDDNELNFYRGDLIRILSKEYDTYSWWIGELNGKVGFVPKSYLMEAYEMC